MQFFYKIKCVINGVYDAVVVTVISPVEVDEPMVFPVMVPMFTCPFVWVIPIKPAPFVVEIARLRMVLF